MQTPLPEPYDPAGQTPQLVPSGDRPVPASPPAQHSPLAQDEVQVVAPVTVCVAMPQLVNARHRDEGKGVRGEEREWSRRGKQWRGKPGRGQDDVWA